MDHVGARARMLGSLLLLAALCSLARSGSAQTIDPVAAELKRRGDEAIDAGLYDEALEAYSRALSIEPTPALHYNRGRALQALGRFADALLELETFKRDAPAELLSAVPRLDEMIESVRSRVGRLRLVTQPIDARVYLDNVEVADRRHGGLVLDAGEHQLRVEAADHVSHEQRFTLGRNDERTITIELTPVPRMARVHVESSVVGASVEVDGRDAGTVPLDLELTPGSHGLRVHHPDYRDARSTVVVDAGQSRRLRIDLDRPPAVVETWWFWGGVGALVATGVMTAVALSTEKSPGTGDIPPGRISAPLAAF